MAALLRRETGDELAEVGHLDLHFIFDFERDGCLRSILGYCGVKWLEVNCAAPEGPMLVAGPIVIVKVNVVETPPHPAHPFHRIQVGEQIVMPDVHAETQGWIIN